MKSARAFARTGVGLLAAAVICQFWTMGAYADSIVLNPVRDNTIINNLSAEYSNGAGDAIYAGRTGLMNNNQELRATLKFDLSAVPPGSTIISASLSLFMVSSISGDELMSLHRMVADWGEGASNFPGGAGAPAEASDVTWNYRFYFDEAWTNPGGDFVAAPSASSICAFSGIDYVWSSIAMAEDAQSWTNDPCSNFGWILIGNEVDTYTAKRFASREWAGDPTARPRLTISYVPAIVCAGDVNHNHVVDIDDLVGVITSWGACALTCNCPGDQDHNATVDIDDLVTVITHWGACPGK